jgi:hypothetical protein
MTATATIARKCSRLLLLSFVLLGAAAIPASASTLTYTNSPAGIGTAFTIDWGVLGPDLTPVGSPFTTGPVTVSGASAFSVFSGATYNADFLPTDMVLSLFDLDTFSPVGGMFRIDFAAPVNAVGARVQANSFGAFAGTISAYDASHVLLGSFVVNGVNGGNGDGSAVFAGVLSDAFNISRIEFAGFGAGAAIGELRAGTAAAEVPEPATMTLLLGGGAILAARRRQLGRR